jgi:Mrp family chromosome partitioning ATPase
MTILNQMAQNIIGIIHEGSPMVCKKKNCKQNWWHGEPKIKIGYEALGVARVSRKPLQNSIMIIGIGDAIGKNHYYGMGAHSCMI